MSPTPETLAYPTLVLAPPLDHRIRRHLRRRAASLRLSFFTENVGTINDISGKARLFLVLPDAFLGAFLILWIFTSLSHTLEKLQVLLLELRWTTLCLCCTLQS